MKIAPRKIETNTHQLKGTYTVGKRVINEAGDSVIVTEDRNNAATVSITKGGVFHRGARIA